MIVNGILGGIIAIGELEGMITNGVLRGIDRQTDRTRHLFLQKICFIVQNALHVSLRFKTIIKHRHSNINEIKHPKYKTVIFGGNYFLSFPTVPASYDGLIKTRNTQRVLSNKNIV
jgi:hypothetical protein